MIEKHLVFISSTSDRKAERSALADAFATDQSFEPYLFEHDRARGISPQKRCAEMISASDGFIGILGTEYGSSYEEQVDGKEGRSITEWEFDTASQRDDLEIMMFVSADTSGAGVDERQKSFLDKVQQFHNGKWCKFFSTPAELVSLVNVSLKQWLAEYVVQLKNRANSVSRKRMRLGLTVCLGIIFMVLSAVVGHLVLDIFNKGVVLAICGAAVGAIIVIYLLVLGDV